ncbi:MAG: alkaline phosphatase family protein [Flavobacteriales bacterium]|nr:alkaline phosphatase family protein [Flavobacteriales bacterium]
MKKKNKVLLVGWDAADWKVITPLMEAGEMPALKSMVEQGVMANIATLEPVFSPMLWTSIATGKYADKHGILGFTEPDTNTIGVRPVSVTSRKTKAIWNILSQQNFKTNIIGWWPSHPAEPVNGICVSNFYQRASKPIEEFWPMLPGTVHPKELTSVFKELRLHPAELTEAHLMPFIPNLDKINQEEDKRWEGIMKILADTATIHNAATWSMENSEWDFMAVYFDAIDHFSHLCMKFHPPQLPGIPNDLFSIYKEVVNSSYKFHDMMLERLIKLAGNDCTVILLSDHGFHSDHNRPLLLPKVPAAPAYEHRPYGVFCVKGPGIKKDERVYGINLLDIAPTVLHLFNLPVGEDMDGKVIQQIFEEYIPIKRIPSWDLVQGASGMHPDGLKQDPQSAQEALKQLVELGYIEQPDENAEKAVERTLFEQNVNLARVYMGSGRYKKAVEILEKLFEKNKEIRIATRLARCYYQLYENQKAEEVIKQTLLPDEKESMALKLIEGQLLLRKNKPKEAIKLFKEMQKKIGFSTHLLQEVGSGFLLLKKWKMAEKIFLQILQNDPDVAPAYNGLAVAYIEQKRYEEAAEASLNAIGLFFEFPMAHYHLGLALFHLNEFEHAARAFEVALKFLPNLAKARNYLIEIYSNHLKDAEALVKIQEVKDRVDTDSNEEFLLQQNSLDTQHLIEKHQKEKEKFYEGEIIIVSGLPRSGTSMLMQMLQQTELEIFTDNERQADENNPKGYLEHEAVKRLARDKAWLPLANGKVVKIISHLLVHLPSRFKYKIIFIHRNLNEILSSQHKMLVREGKIKEGEFRAGLQMAYKENLKRIAMWESSNSNVEMLHLKYAEIIENTEVEALKIKTFLKIKTDTKKMAEVVEKKLYRNKNND